MPVLQDIDVKPLRGEKERTMRKNLFLFVFLLITSNAFAENFSDRLIAFEIPDGYEVEDSGGGEYLLKPTAMTGTNSTAAARISFREPDEPVADLVSMDDFAKNEIHSTDKASVDMFDEAQTKILGNDGNSYIYTYTDLDGSVEKKAYAFYVPVGRRVLSVTISGSTEEFDAVWNDLRPILRTLAVSENY